MALVRDASLERLAGAGADEPATARGPALESSVDRVRDRTGVAQLVAAVEQFNAAGETDRRAAFRKLLERMKEAKDAGQVDAMAASLRSALTPMLDYTSAQSLNRLYKELPPSARGRTKLRLAILGGFTTHQLRDLIELYLFATGVAAEIYETEYGVFQQEILDPSSRLYEFKPNALYLATHWRNLGHLPKLSDSAQDVSALLEAEYRNWATLWQTAHDRL